MSEQANMAARYEHEIPKGYKVRIEGNKVVFELKESENEKIMKEFEKAFLERIFHQKVEDLDEENREIFREDARCVLELARKYLQSEHPEVDLEEEIKKYCRDYYNCDYPDQIQNETCGPVMPHIVDAARHFAEWGAIHLNARKEEKK